MSADCNSLISAVSFSPYSMLPARSDARLSAFIMSIMPSADDNESFPFMKARFVYSPFSAARAPSDIVLESIPRAILTPPWQWNSTTSSPVNDFGALKYTHIPKSVKSPPSILPAYITFG